MAGFDKVDPANPCLLPIDVFLRCCPRMTTERVFKPYREMRACDLDKGIPVAGEYAVHRRTGMASKVRVLTS
jgi:hypothetical protein